MIKMKNIKAIFRRGQAQASSKSEQGQLQGQIREDLSRSSSVTNLNADHKNKGAFSKLRKSASKDKLDKLADKKNEKKGIPSNNNKLESGDVDHSLDSLQEIEHLQKQLTEMAKEKSELALELGERKGELQILKNEIVKLKMFQEQSSVRIEQLNDENTSLRNRLRDVAHSPLSDNEKQQLLLDTHRHSSAPASIATNVSLLEDGTVGDITACPTPDWDKHSSSNVSEVSVACLQDKINQMQETHYSTNEELQATLQELTDLQRQLTELQQDNERLLDEKNLMFDSLCRQTERLNDARAEVESLKQLLYRDKDETGQFESIVDREQKLVDLLKSAQEERESLLVKQEQLNNELQDARAANIEQITEIEQLTERVRTLESTLDAKHAEHRQLDQELAIAKDQCSGRQIEINRLTDLLENARTKINELEQERALNDKSELDELLDNARKEKDALESEVANLKEQVARSRNETEKLREQVSILQEECKVTRNNAKCTQSELEYKCEKLTAEKNNLNEQLQQLQDAANELQVQAQCQLEDKRQLSSVLSETQRNLSEAERKNTELDSEVEELKRLRKEENEEWEKFQNDLLTSVRVANDFKSEAQQELQKMIMENKAHRERVRQLEAQIDKLKGSTREEPITPAFTSPTLHTYETKGKLGFTQKSSHEAKSDISNPNPAIIPDVIDTSHSKQEILETTKRKSKFLPMLPIVSRKIHSDGKQKSTKSSEDSENDGGKKLKFLPVLSKVTRKNETKPEDNKAQSTSDDTESSVIRYSDSSRIINSKSEPELHTFNDDKTTKFSNLNIVRRRKEAKNIVKNTERRLSDQEERNLAILNNLYSQIDQNIPEEHLTTDQKFIIKLKDVFENDNNPKTKPIAKKPKDKLAISKPLLDSVLNNPKLKEITEDSNMIQVDNDVASDVQEESGFSSEFKEFVSSDPNFSKRYEMVLKPDTKFDDLFHSNIEFSYYEDDKIAKSVSSFKPEALITKSKSLDNIYYKQHFTDELNELPHSLSSFTKSSEKPRSDDMEIDYEQGENIRWENITSDTLDKLYSKIDLNTPEEQLTKEEKFIISLKKSLDEMGRKNTLRRLALKRKKKKEISQPTEVSVLRNSKLVSILNDPGVRIKDDILNKPNKVTRISVGSSIETKPENQGNSTKLLRKKSNSFGDLPSIKYNIDETTTFKIPRPKLATSTPNIAEQTDKTEPCVINDTNKIGRYQKNLQSGQFYRVKRAYDLQTLRPREDKRKVSINLESDSDTEAICFLDKRRNSEVHSEIYETRKVNDDRDLSISTTENHFETIAEAHNEERNLSSEKSLQNPKTQVDYNLKRNTFSGVIPEVQAHNSNASDTSSIEEDLLSSLKSKLDENEFDLVQRIKDDPEYSRPNSDINEEDLKLIAQAQRLHSLEINSDFSDTEHESCEPTKKTSGLSIQSSTQQNEATAPVECYNSNLGIGSKDQKIESSNKFEDYLSSPQPQVKSRPVSLDSAIVENFDYLNDRNGLFRRSLNEPIYANYSTFLKDMIYEDNKEKEPPKEKLTPSRKPLPLPRTKSMNEGNLEGEGESNSQSKKFDSSIEPTTISKITSDISNLTSSLAHFDDKSHRDMINNSTEISKLNQDDVEGYGEIPPTEIKVFGNVEKYYATHSIGNDLVSGDVPRTTIQKHTTYKNIALQESHISEEEDQDLIEQENRVSEEGEGDQDSIDEEKDDNKNQNQKWKSTTENSTETEDFFDCLEPTKLDSKHNINTQTAQEDGFSILNIIDKLGHIINDKLAAPVPKPTTSTGTAPIKELEEKSEKKHKPKKNRIEPEFITVQDNDTQTSQPVIVEHHYRSKKKNKEKDIYSLNEPNYDSLERVAAFHVINNPPKPLHTLDKHEDHVLLNQRYSAMPNFHVEAAKDFAKPQENRSSFQYAKNKFETMIQANQQQYQFKSETMRRATMSGLPRLPTDFPSKETPENIIKDVHPNF